MNTFARTTRRYRRGFSVIEMLVAITISSVLLTATMGALNAMFKGYQQTTDTASAHIVARIAVNRILSMVRTGSDFGPFPTDVLNSTQNPLVADYFEYVSARDANDIATQITRIELCYPGHEPPHRTWAPEESPPALDFTPSGPADLNVVLINPANGEENSYLLIQGVNNVQFTLEYDVGPRLTRATIDVTVNSAPPEDLDVTTGAIPQTVRLVASAMPRRSILED